MNKQQLASKIWESANQMRSKIEANEYKDYILGFIFYKYLSEQEVRWCRSEGMTDEDIASLLTEEDRDTMGWVQEHFGYFIAYENLFQTWVAAGADFTVANVRDALSAFERLIYRPQANPGKYQNVYGGIFETLQTGLSKLGGTERDQSKAVRDLVHLIDDIPMDGKQDYDVLGFIYEYLISNFAANAGKKAGEFYTPHEVSVLMSEIIAHDLADRDEITIYDPTSGSGSLLINIGNAYAKRGHDRNAITYYAQELKENTYNLTRMNLVMRGINADNIFTRNGDTLEDDWPYFDNDPASYEYRPADAVVSNPPYSLKWDSANKQNEERFSYGIAPKSKADYAFLLHDLYHLRPDGIMCIVLPHGVLFRGGEEARIRTNLLEHNHIEAIIGLPANIFYGTGIPTIIMVLRQNRSDSSVLIVDGSKHFEKAGKSNRLRASDIKRIVDAVTLKLEIPKFSRLVTLDEIRANDYNLNIPRYVDSSDAVESWDLYATLLGGIPKEELAALGRYWKAWPHLFDGLFNDDGSPYAHLKVEDVKKFVKTSVDIEAFHRAFAKAFDGFDDELKGYLIEDPCSVDPSQGEEAVDKSVLDRMKDTPLLDRYDAYQVVDDCWQVISQDLETLQADGEGALMAIDPRMVVKNKKEVQQGWQGRILPFDLVQEKLLPHRLEEVRQAEQRLSAIADEIGQLAENLSEEEKSGKDAINDAGDGFVAAAAKKDAKEIKAAQKRGEVFGEDSYELAVLEYLKLASEQTALKKRLKDQAAKLEDETKATVEGLTLSEAKDLLAFKWIEPLSKGLGSLADEVVERFVKAIDDMAKKYAVTYADLAHDIEEEEKQLVGMLKDLTGSSWDMAGIAELEKLLGGE